MLFQADHFVEQMQAFAVCRQYAGTHFNGLAQARLAQMADMRLHRIPGKARRDIVLPCADHAEHHVGRIAEQLEIAIFGEVLVVVDPFGLNRRCYRQQPSICKRGTIRCGPPVQPKPMRPGNRA